MKLVLYLYSYSSHTRLYALDSCLGEKQNKIITEVRSLCKYRENISARPLAAFAEAIKIYSKNANFKQLQKKETFGDHMSETIPWIWLLYCWSKPKDFHKLSWFSSFMLKQILCKSAFSIFWAGLRGWGQRMHTYICKFVFSWKEKKKGPK